MAIVKANAPFYMGSCCLKQDGARENGVCDYLHYWFVESECDPAKDPVVLWLNGMESYCIAPAELLRLLLSCVQEP